MSQSDFAMMCFAVPCIAFWIGVMAGLMYANFVWEERGSTKRQPRYGTQPFKPESKIKPFRKHPDMLKDDEI